MRYISVVPPTKDNKLDEGTYITAAGTVHIGGVPGFGFSRTASIYDETPPEGVTADLWREWQERHRATVYYPAEDQQEV